MTTKPILRSPVPHNTTRISARIRAFSGSMCGEAHWADWMAEGTVMSEPFSAANREKTGNLLALGHLGPAQAPVGRQNAVQLKLNQTPQYKGIELFQSRRLLPSQVVGSLPFNSTTLRQGFVILSFRAAHPETIFGAVRGTTVNGS